MSILSTIESDATATFKEVESIFESPAVLAIAEVLATGAGAGSALVIMRKVGGSSADILALSSAAYTVLAGKTPPTEAQILAIFTSFKSNATTAAYSALATELAPILSAFVQKYASENWVKISSWYVYGWQIAAEINAGLSLTLPTLAAELTPTT